MRAIDISAIPPVPATDQPAPMLDWIAIDRLVIDDEYQRGLGNGNWASIRKIAADFRWSRFTPVLVAPIEGGLFAIIDGQHRAHAAAICGFEKVPAMAVHMSRAEQASAFSWINGQVVRISAHQVYKAALTAGEEWALRSQLAVDQAGCRLMTYNKSSSQKKPGEIFSVGMIRDFVVARNQATAVTAALRGIREFDTTGRVTLYSDYVVKPLIQVLIEDPALVHADIAGAFREADPFKVLDQAERARNLGTTALTAHRVALRKLVSRHAQKRVA